jgi:ABC-type glycerol-3-phosphate transport system permease component
MRVIAGIGGKRAAELALRFDAAITKPQVQPILWNEMAAAGVIAMALPLILMVIGRRYIVAGLTFGVIREK